MKPKLLTWVACVLPVLFVSAGFGQQVDSMMELYAKKLPVEKIHIHFDKTVYNKTETVWYKVYVLQGEYAFDSKNVYVEWYDSDGKMITQTVAPLYQSAANGSFQIPADYKGESLRMRAFTRWMLNDAPAFLYEKELTVNVNPQKTSARPILPVLRTKVEIFPEGGFLVQGLNSHVAFKATNQYGNPVFVKGVVVNNNNVVLDTLITRHDGMGSFYLSPSAQEKYQVNWTDENGVTGTTPIPVTKIEGAKMHIRTVNANRVKFLIERTANAPQNFKRLFLLAHMNKVLFYKFEINSSVKTVGDAELKIDSLPTGLLQFTLFTSDWIPVAERVVFINKHTHTFDASIETTTVNLGKRGKNVFEISVADTLPTNMSLSVTDASLHPLDQSTIYSDILLKSEIKGKINNPGYYFSSDADSVAEHLDLVMLTNGWRGFDWDKIRTHTPPAVVYEAETDYLTIRGKVQGMKERALEQEPIVNLFVQGKDSSKQVFFTPVEKNGTFSQPVFFYDTSRVYYSISNENKYGDLKFRLDNGLMKFTQKKIPALPGRAYLWSDSLAKTKLDLLLSEQELLQKKMRETTLQEVTVTTRVKTKEEVLNEKYATGFFAGGQAKIFDLTDLTKVGDKRNIFEYLEGKVANLLITWDGDRLMISWRYETPTYFINEMQQTDHQTIINIPMMDVAMIKTYPPVFMFATGGGRGGAIAVWTKKGGDAKSPDTKGLENVMLTGYTRFKEFYNPVYEEPMMGFKGDDRRTTLYWNPSVSTDSKNKTARVEFYNNDITEKFQVVLEGINSAGKMVRIVKTLSNNE